MSVCCKQREAWSVWSVNNAGDSSTINGLQKLRSSDWIRITKPRNERYLVVTLRYERSQKQVLRCATVISDLDRSGDPVCGPASKAKAHNYYNGETARGCIRWSCDLSTGYGSNLRSRIVTSPAISSSMITVRVSKKGPPGPPAAFTCAKSAVTHEIAISVARKKRRRLSLVIVKWWGEIRNFSRVLLLRHYFGDDRA